MFQHFDPSRPIDAPTSSFHGGGLSQVQGTSAAPMSLAQGQGAQVVSSQIDPYMFYDPGDPGRMLYEQMMGIGGPSAGQQQLQQGIGQQQAGALSMARSNANLPPALAMRMAQEQQSQAGLIGGQQMQALRAQEMAQGREAYANYQMNQSGENDAMKKFWIDQATQRAGAGLDAQAAVIAMQEQASQAEKDRIDKYIGAGLATGGAVIGGIYGGPAGAAAGGAAGNAAAGAVTQ